jgi:hypothetical protein
VLGLLFNRLELGIKRIDVKISPSEGATGGFGRFFKDFFAWFHALDESPAKLMF